MFPCRTLLRSLCLTIDNGGHITQLMFYLTIMEANILLGCGNMTPDINMVVAGPIVDTKEDGEVDQERSEHTSMS